MFSTFSITLMKNYIFLFKIFFFWNFPKQLASVTFPTVKSISLKKSFFYFKFKQKSFQNSTCENNSIPFEFIYFEPQFQCIKRTTTTRKFWITKIFFIISFKIFHAKISSSLSKFIAETSCKQFAENFECSSVDADFVRLLIAKIKCCIESAFAWCEAAQMHTLCNWIVQTSKNFCFFIPSSVFQLDVHY